MIGLAVARAVARRGHEVVVAEAAGHRHGHLLAQQRGHPWWHVLPDRLAARAPLRAWPAHALRILRLARRAASQMRQADRRHQPSRARQDPSDRSAGRINGVESLETIGGNAARALEPELSCIGALLSPETGIIDAILYAGAARRSRGCGRGDRLQHDGGARGVQQRTMAGPVRRRVKHSLSTPWSIAPGSARKRWRALWGLSGGSCAAVGHG